MESIEDFDYTLSELVENPPYNHPDMVRMLAEGRFIVEGKPSTFSQAHYFASEHSNYPQVWEALSEFTNVTE